MAAALRVGEHRAGRQEVAGTHDLVDVDRPLDQEGQLSSDLVERRRVGM